MSEHENCHVEPVVKQPSNVEMEQVEHARLVIQGMGCVNCAARVRNSLVKREGVLDAQVDHFSGTARVAFNPSLIATEGLERAVAEAGGDGRHEYRGRVVILSTMRRETAV